MFDRNANPHVRKYTCGMENHVAGMVEVEYETILAQSMKRLHELRVDWSEMGALHQVLDELSCRISYYWYVKDFPDLFMENIEKSEEYPPMPEMHPRAIEIARGDAVLQRWIEVNPRASEVLPNISGGHYTASLSKQRARLYELRAEEGVSELGALYTLIDELCAEAAHRKNRAGTASFVFFEKRKVA